MNQPARVPRGGPVEVPPSGTPARVPPLGGGPLKHYTLVDYATQGYVALVALLILCFHNATVPQWPWLLAVHALNLAVVHGLIQWQARHPDNGILELLRHFYPVLLYAWLYAETGRINRMFFPEYLDPTLIRWEHAIFGGQPSLVFMDKLPYLAFSELMYAAYFSYYLMIGGVGLALFVRNRQQFFHYVTVVSLVFYACYLTYIVLPIIGPPIFLLHLPDYTLPADLLSLMPAQAYPDAIQGGVFFRLMAWLYHEVEAPGAAFPSSHVAIALCTVFFSFRYLRRIRFVHLALALLLCLSTVYGRYHYVLDVFAGVLTAVVCVPLANWLYFRSQTRVEPGKESGESQPATGRS